MRAIQALGASTGIRGTYESNTGIRGTYESNTGIRGTYNCHLKQLCVYISKNGPDLG